MTARVTAETRAALVAEANRSGRSIGDVAERWIDEARQGHATVEALLGGPGVADIMRSMIGFIQYASDVLDHPEFNASRGIVIAEGIKVLADKIKPSTPADPIKMKLAELMKEVDVKLAETLVQVSSLLRKMKESGGYNLRSVFVRQAANQLMDEIEKGSSYSIGGRMNRLTELRESLPEEHSHVCDIANGALDAFAEVWAAQLATGESSAQIGRRLAAAFSDDPRFDAPTHHPSNSAASIATEQRIDLTNNGFRPFEGDRL